MPNLFPEEKIPIEEANPQETIDEIPIGRSWRFDFQTGDFSQSPSGSARSIDGIELYKQWAYKVLATPRYKHLSYSRSYGQELEELIGSGLSKQAIESEVRRMVTETLMVIPQTITVNQFVFEWKEDALYYSCEVSTTFGEDRIEQRLEGVI